MYKLLLIQPDYGDRIHPKKGDVPCFWACGVSAGSALGFAKLPLAATHAPGCMFICDKITKSKENKDVAAVEINAEKKNYSLCLRESAEKIDLIEATAARDPGHRYVFIKLGFR